MCLNTLKLNINTHKKIKHYDFILKQSEKITNVYVYISVWHAICYIE